MGRIKILFAMSLVLLLVACSQKQSGEASSDSSSPRATVLLRDGTKLSGAVTASTPSQITLKMDAGGTRTILMKDVKSVDYGEGTSHPASGTTAATADSKAVNNSQPRVRPDK